MSRKTVYDSIWHCFHVTYSNHYSTGVDVRKLMYHDGHIGQSCYFVCKMAKTNFVRPKGRTDSLAALKGRPCFCTSLRPHTSY